MVGHCSEVVCCKHQELVYMKIFIYTLIVLAAGLILYNLTFLDFENLFSDESATALIGILASAIVIVLMVILLVSRAIARKADK